MPDEIERGRCQEAGREAVFPSVYSLILPFMFSALYLKGRKSVVVNPKLPSWLFSQRLGLKNFPWTYLFGILYICSVSFSKDV